MNEKQPREMAVNIHIESGDSIVGVWNEKEQKLVLKVLRDGKNVSAEQIQLTTLYQRSKKPKILNQLEFEKSSEFSVSHSESLLLYDQVWAIDTNKREIFGKNVHVSAVTVCSTDGTEVYFPVLAIIFGHVAGNPELFGWRKFIEFIQSTEQFNPEHRYGLVVDSDFSRISSFNERKEAICGNFYLPKNWNLIYATSDSRKESILNKIIAESDKISSQILDLISTKESNSKYWDPVNDEDKYQPAILPLAKAQS